MHPPRLYLMPGFLPSPSSPLPPSLPSPTIFNQFLCSLRPWLLSKPFEALQSLRKSGEGMGGGNSVAAISPVPKLQTKRKKKKNMKERKKENRHRRIAELDWCKIGLMTGRWRWRPLRHFRKFEINTKYARKILKFSPCMNNESVFISK